MKQTFDRNKKSYNREMSEFDRHVQKRDNVGETIEKLEKELKAASDKRYNCNPNYQIGSESCVYANNNYKRLFRELEQSTESYNRSTKRASNLRQEIVRKNKQRKKQLDLFKSSCVEKEYSVEVYNSICVDGEEKGSAYCKNFFL